MESFTIELVSNEDAQLFPDITLSSFINFLPEKLTLEGQREFTISEISYPAMYQNVIEGKFMFFDKTFRKDTSTAKAVPQLKCFEERKKFRFTWQMKYLVLHSLKRTWDTISVAVLAKNLEWFSEEKDLTNQNLLTTLSTYTLSWYTPTRVSRISLAAGRLICCIASFSFQSSKLETL